ncbi:hypothetical protein Dimus_006346 [Dionaea muscipula]
MGGCPLQSERQNLTTWNSREIICQRKESLLKDELMQIAGNNGNSGEIRCLEHELDLNNVALVLLEAGLARIQTTFGICRISDGHLLVQAEELAKQQKLQIWEDYVEGQEVANGSAAENKQKEVLQINSGAACFSESWRSSGLVWIIHGLESSHDGKLVTVPSAGVVKSPQDEFEVFYVDYGNQEKVPYSQLRPIELRKSSLWWQGCGILTSGRTFKARIEVRDTSGGTAKGQGTGTIHPYGDTA